MLEKVRHAPRNLITFYGDVKTELRKVTWPSKKEVRGTTLVVIITVFFFGVYLALVDVVLSRLVRQVIDFF
jgi:preprotein translocase subunit SecE